MLFVAGIVLGLGLLQLQLSVSAARKAPVVQGVAATVTSTLKGTTRAADGKALEGVAVSARAVDQTFATTVFSDEQGEYYFPFLAAGKYHVWAQAVGFQAARAEVTLDATERAGQALTLDPIADFTEQLSGAEWLDALPEATQSDRRMKEV